MNNKLKNCCLEILSIFEQKRHDFIFMDKKTGFHLLIGKTIYQVFEGDRQTIEDSVTGTRQIFVESGQQFHDFMKGVFE